MKKDTVIQVFLAIIVVVLAGYTIAFGFALENIITQTLGQPNPVVFLNGFLLYYFIGGFVTRYLLQSLPVLDAQPYLHLPIPRKMIGNFLIGKSLIHIINISVFFIFTPFAFGAVEGKYGTGPAWSWLISIWLISMINHFLIVVVKTMRIENGWKLYLFVLLVAFIACADHFGWLKITELSEQLFVMSLNGYTFAGCLLGIVFLFYVFVHKLFISKLYADEFLSTTKQIQQSELTFLQQFGMLGSWIALELKLILRNKRSRELFLMHIVFVLLPLGFYSFAKHQDSYGSFLLFALISSGFFTMNYGQFLFSWQGSHFDFTLSRPVSLRQVVESKYWLLTTTTVAWFLMSIPYILMGWHFLLIHLVASLYNIGVNTFVVMNMSMWGAKKINLKHPGSINMEGMGAAQWLMGIPLIATPYIVYIPLSLLGYSIAGLVSVGLLGVIGILLKNANIDFTTQRLGNNRHILASNFRKE